jgi:hypothetical protein
VKARRLASLLLVLLVPARFVSADPLSDLDAAERLWLNSHLGSYSYLIYVGGPFGAGTYAISVTARHCIATFKSGTGMYVEGLPPITCQFRTIPELFAELRRDLEMEPTALKELRFNATYGYPEHIFVNPELVDQSSTTDITHFVVKQ